VGYTALEQSGIGSIGGVVMRLSMRAAGLVIAAIGLTVAATSTAQGATPIRAHQHFRGVVNGKTADAFIRIACPGPAEQTGAILSGQTLAVTHVRAGGGFTGPFSQVYAWIVPAAGSTARPVQVEFKNYNITMPMPAGITVPCDGSAQVEFSSCPYLAPCAFGWTPEYVTVRFVNVAA
jgi:hypothetical protein